jgi:competence protein ComEA
MCRRLLWALLSFIVLAACTSGPQPIIIETPLASGTPYVTPAPTLKPTRTPAPTRTPRTTGTPSAVATVLALNPAGKVNINEADADTLDLLPHIGPALAQRIIDYRLAHGPFKRIEDINNVKGIGDAIFSAIKDLITVGD